MARKQKTIHYLYKTTCLVTNRYYIGMHSTCNIEDGYMGSGRRLRRSMRKYGKDNHVKEILEFFESRELLVEAEIKAITPEMVNDDMCMNLMGGGGGGFVSHDACSKGGRNAINKIHYTEWVVNGTMNRERLAKQNSENWKNPKFRGKMLVVMNWTGKKHSEETKEKMSEIKKGKGTSENNSQFGTSWITKNGVNNKIKKEDLDKWVGDGWVKGREI